MKITLETITPPIATKYLEAAGRNRRPAPTRVRLYASEMLSGRWRLTHQGIAFNCDGSLRDGQHRLAAIVMSGKSQQMFVARGLSNDGLSMKEVAVAKALWEVYANQRWDYAWGGSGFCDRETLLDFMLFHREAIEFSRPTTSSKGLSHACVRTAIASAFWTRDQERVAKFRDQLQTGVVEQSTKDGAVVRLRDWLVSSGTTRGGSHQRQEVYGRTCTALYAYLEGRNLTKLYWRKDAVFMLPVQEKWVPAALIVERHKA